jgi:hypothetical protein
MMSGVFAKTATAFYASLWILHQSVIVGGLGFIYFAIPFFTLCAVLMIAFIRQERGSRRRLLPAILLLPSIWIFIILWGGFFWADLDHGQRNPAWVGYPIIAVPFVFVMLAGFFIGRLRGARIFTAIYAVTNLYFVLTGCFIALMAVTGDWI